MPDLIAADRSGKTAPRFELKLLALPGVLPDDAMSEAGRKLLFQQFEVMLKHEPQVRSGTDREAIHDMRVATRRMRSAFRLFAPFYKPKISRQFGDFLRDTARMLGAVRDLDVFQEKLEKHAETLKEGDREGLEAFGKHIAQPEQAARRALITYLDGSKYRGFVLDFHEFLTEPGAGSIGKVGPGKPHLVRHAVPLLVYEQITTIRSYEPGLNVATLDDLHMLRVEGKRLRYTLEFFTEVLGEETKTVIGAVKALQDHLGDLQDARVAVELLQQYIASAGERADLSSVLKYLATRDAEKQRLLNGLSEAWATFSDPKIRRALALAVSVL